MWSNYWSYFATTPAYTPSYDWNWNIYSYPAYNYNYNVYSYPAYPNYTYPTYDYSSYFNTTPSYSTPSNNYHASNDVKIPANTKITQIDSDTQLGRQLLGKIGR